MASPIARLAGYELEGLIGRGSTGSVYRARPVAGGGEVALKRVRWSGGAQPVERLRSETAVLARLDHPHILEVVELIADADGLAIAMQLACGGSLGDLLGHGPRVPIEQGAEIVAKVADALAAAHANSILHCDVKPSNILMDQAGTPLLSDFGLARVISGAPRGGDVFGTAEYLDPDVARGDDPTPASDVYSVGVVCYQILAGRLPYQGVTPSATLRLADRGRPPLLAEIAPEVPACLIAVVERAMARQASARPSSASELADAVRASTLGSRVRARRAPFDDHLAEQQSGPRPLRPRRPGRHRPEQLSLSRRARSAAVLTVVALVTMGLALVWWVRPARGSRSAAVCDSTVVRPRVGASDLGAVILLADAAGHGCRVPVVWSSGVITVPLEAGRPPARFALGQPGDVLLLGHWDCRSTATPALYRPATGQVFYYGGWAVMGTDLSPNEVETTQVTHGSPKVVRDGTGDCERVAVTRPH